MITQFKAEYNMVYTYLKNKVTTNLKHETDSQKPKGNIIQKYQNHKKKKKKEGDKEGNLKIRGKQDLK